LHVKIQCSINLQKANKKYIHNRNAELLDEYISDYM
jgi:hypothetical protein